MVLDRRVWLHDLVSFWLLLIDFSGKLCFLDYSQVDFGLSYASEGRLQATISTVPDIIHYPLFGSPYLPLQDFPRTDLHRTVHLLLVVWFSIPSLPPTTCIRSPPPGLHLYISGTA